MLVFSAVLDYNKLKNNKKERVSILLKDEAYAHIINLINDGEIEYGKIYSLNDVLADLNISRTPVRDAIQMLHDEKRIEVLPSRGFRLRRVTKDEVLDLFHFSIALEGYCVANLAHWSKEHKYCESIEHLRLLVEQMRTSDLDHITFSDFFHLDNEFHYTIVKSMHNSVFDELLRSPGGFYNRPEMHISDTCEDRLAILQEHQHILDAICSGDSMAAFMALKYHAEILYKRYLSIENASANQI